MPDYRFYSKKQYFAHAAKRFAGAGEGDRILLMSMAFEPDEPEIARMVEGLLTAARNGAEVTLGIDAICFMHPNGKPGRAWYRPAYFGPLVYHRQLPIKLQPPYALKQQTLEALAAYPNVKAVITNRPSHRFSLRIAGRSHIKTVIINDEVLLGGCNLDYPGNIDMMVGFRHQIVADKLYNLLTDGLKDGNIRRSFQYRDARISVDADTRILVDAGVPGQSAIFDQVLRLIDSADEWLMISCQFFPNGVTARHLAAAYERGVKVTVLYPPVSKFRPSDRPLQYFSRIIEHVRIPSVLFEQQLPVTKPLVHAKVVASDQGVMVGSHNYVSPGVKLGTAEIALYSNDSRIAKRAFDSLMDQIFNKPSNS